VNLRRLRSAIVDRDLSENVLGPALRVLDEDIKVTVFIEDARVE
jgi:hypothetical protein